MKDNCNGKVCCSTILWNTTLQAILRDIPFPKLASALQSPGYPLYRKVSSRHWQSSTINIPDIQISVSAQLNYWWQSTFVRMYRVSVSAIRRHPGWATLAWQFIEPKNRPTKSYNCDLQAQQCKSPVSSQTPSPFIVSCISSPPFSAMNWSNQRKLLESAVVRIYLQMPPFGW